MIKNVSKFLVITFVICLLFLFYSTFNFDKTITMNSNNRTNSSNPETTSSNSDENISTEINKVESSMSASNSTQIGYDENNLTNNQIKRLKDISDSIYNDYTKDIEFGFIEVSYEKTINKLILLDELCSIIQELKSNDRNNIILKINTNYELGKLYEDKDKKIEHYTNVIELCTYGLSLDLSNSDNNFFNYYKAVGLLELGKRIAYEHKIATLIESREYFELLEEYENYQKLHYLLVIGNILYTDTSEIKYLEDSLLTYDQVISLNITDDIRYTFFKELADSYYKVGKYYYEKNLTGKYDKPFKQAKKFVDSAKLINSQITYNSELDLLSENISKIIKEENND